jgi:fatty acid desaturase
MPVRTPSIDWYRTPISRNDLARLNRRSDRRGLQQTFGHLGLMLVTGSAAWFAYSRQAWLLLVIVLFLHGTVAHFLLNGFHELCHKTVFKSRRLNLIFRNLYSFLGWHNPVMFWASHQEHHKFTLHPPDDLEVVFPVHLPFMGFLQSVVINPWRFWMTLKSTWNLSRGRLDGDWEHALFPESDSEHRRRLFNWARSILVGHLLILIVSLYFGLWIIPVLVSLAPFYGGWLLYLCNNAQHVGLQENAADFRLNSRTILLHPIVQFLYWHMNFHIEHHMYAAVPCYNLAELHRLIRHDLPECPAGLYATWAEIIPILKKQQSDPAYFFAPELP